MKTDARILRTKNSEVSLPMILSVGLFESDKFLEDDGHEDHDHSHDAHSHDDHNHDHDDHSACDHDHGQCTHEGHDHHDHKHSDHLAQDGFVSVSFQSDRPISLRKFQHFLDHQLDERIFRAKGLLWFDESPNCHIFHLCGKRFSIDDKEWSKPPSNKLVLIGQNLDQEKLRQQLQDCLTSDKRNVGKGFGKK
jgi:G3E family GTPase